MDIQDVPKSVCGENDILVMILAGSLCKSDVHIYEWKPIPIINGHDFASEVIEAGSGAYKRRLELAKQMAVAAKKELPYGQGFNLKK